MVGGMEMNYYDRRDELEKTMTNSDCSVALRELVPGIIDCSDEEWVAIWRAIEILGGEGKL